MIHPPQLTTLSTTHPGSAADQHTRTERDECRTSKRCRRPGRAVSRAGAVRRHFRSNRQAHRPFAYPSTGTEHAGLRPCAARRGTSAPGTSTTAQRQGGAGYGHTSTAIIVSGRMGSRTTGDQPPKSPTAVPPSVTPVALSMLVFWHDAQLALLPGSISGQEASGLYVVSSSGASL